MTFLNGLEKQLNKTQTWNGALAQASTLDACLDLFSKIGSSRNNIPQIINLFLLAYKENPETATRILFYGRDIRGGQGERSIFKAILKELAIIDSKIVSKLVFLVSIFGRWDDLLVLEDTSVWQDVLNLYASQLEVDIDLLKENKPISLLGKWLPSINASSENTKRLAKKIARFLRMNDKEYRTLLVTLRTKIAIVEQFMCANEWQSINYEHVPSKASLLYRKAFQKHDEDRYKTYVEALKEGKKKINAATLYPYDITVAINGSSYCDKPALKTVERDVLNAQWQALPNYMEGHQLNGLVLADVSGSMYSSYSNKVRPIDVSTSLAAYIAERNTGIWKDQFLVFDSQPRLLKLAAGDIYSKIQAIKNSTRHMGSTNLVGAIEAILNTGLTNNLSDDDMPKMLIIISDMQFNSACSNNKLTNFEKIQEMYKNAGYFMPKIIFWNVNSASNVPMDKDATGTALVSGCSPSILKAVFNTRFLTPIDLMNDAVYTERYAPIGKVFS